MASRRVCLMIIMVLLFYLPSHAVGNENAPAVSQFGDSFEETVIADSSDALVEPRDLEFHPGRANELWIANRATDSITIVENTGMENQTSQNRKDSNRNHFLEEVSAISFGAYHPEFDWQWGSAQETRNTFCGQGAANNFMGPALWPSSLSHFAVENQNNGNGLLGSHIDMLHESPYGVGIAHDSDNAYWYNDGYYGELVYYDFQEDHDTGQDDHSDGIVRRYSEIQLTHAYGIPGHMVLDKDSGILYIADTGANRVVWVNTDDTSVTSQNIMSSSTRLEPLQEYSEMSGIEWGVLATGLNRPTGIALDGDQLFVSQNGNGRIVAYDLSTNGKSAVEAGSIQTTASSIMGLEIGPSGHLYYVDNGQDKVIRVDPFTDGDGDGVVDMNDNCPLVPNADQLNHDSDSMGDVCDEDDDNDGTTDTMDQCPVGEMDWIASQATDHDMDGCRDASEDYDDDNDAVIDIRDDCPTGDLGWTSSTLSDYDNDGCRDIGEDYDDDNDNICDAGGNEVWNCLESSTTVDECPQSQSTFTSMTSNDIDQDGCEDRNEDEDDDNDGFIDKHDDCPTEAGLSDSGRLFGCPDSDGDGYANTIDEFPDESSQWSDVDEDGFGDEKDGFEGDDCRTTSGNSTEDRNGCSDTDGDGWSNPDSLWTAASGADAFIIDETQHLDLDVDGYGDAANGFQADVCPETFGTSSLDRFGCVDTDVDGWSDEGDMLPFDPTQHEDQDMDGFGDSATGNTPDSCLSVYGLSSQQRYGCPDADGDGWDDELDAFPNQVLFWSDLDGDLYPDQNGTNMSDDCPEEWGDSFEDRIGCLDSDGDGWSDAADAFPTDAQRYLASDGLSMSLLVSITGLVIVGLTVGLLFLNKRRDDPVVGMEAIKDAPMAFAPIQPQRPTQVAPQVAPQLPPGGLPQGWTMEQWAWYGEDFLKNQ